jgi:C4-dicarboxylate-specific signal transduction histidine kinase
VSTHNADAWGIDLTEHKRAEELVRKLEWDFARINSVSIMAELAASLFNEIAEPIGSARNYARAAQNFLEMQPPHLGKVKEALGSIVVNADRAGEIIDRIREHMKKAPSRKERSDLNAAVHELIVLARSTIIRNGVSVQTRLIEQSIPIQGDRSTPTSRFASDAGRG